jgi:hypothetical protein
MVKLEDFKHPEDICELLSFSVEEEPEGVDLWPITSVYPSKYFADINRQKEAGLGLTNIYCLKEYGNDAIVRCAAKLGVVKDGKINYGKFEKMIWRPYGHSKIHSFGSKNTVHKTKITATSCMIDERTFLVKYDVIGDKVTAAIFTFFNQPVNIEFIEKSQDAVARSMYLVQDKETGHWIAIKLIKDVERHGLFPDIISAIKNEKGGMQRILCQTKELTNSVSMFISVGKDKNEVIKHLDTHYKDSPDECMAKVKEKWTQFFDSCKVVTDDVKLKKAHYYGMYIVKANEVDAFKEKPPGITHKAIFPSRVSYRGVWLWDTAFLSAPLIATKDYEVCEGAVLTLLDNQRADGSIPNCVVPTREEPLWPPISQPPLLSMNALMIYKAKKYYEDEKRALAFLKQAYPRLKKFHEFWYKQRDKDKDGMCEYLSRSYSGIYYSFESGVDDSPLWDEQGAEAVEDLALNIFLILDKRYLALIEKLLKENGVSRFIGTNSAFNKEADKCEQIIINEFYDNDLKLFFSRHRDSHELIKIKTFECLLPLLLDNLDDKVKDALVKHLKNTSEFWTPYPVPTVAKDDPTFGTRWGSVCWRKPVWMSVNWLIAKGLMKHGYYREAKELINKSIELILNSAISEYSKERFAENYDPDTGRKSKDGYAEFFGWNGLVSDMITSMIGGLDFYDPRGNLIIYPICEQNLGVKKFDTFCITKKGKYTFGFNNKNVMTIAEGVKCEILERGKDKLKLRLTSPKNNVKLTAYGEYFNGKITVKVNGKEIGTFAESCGGETLSWLQPTFPAEVEIERSCNL